MIELKLAHLCAFVALLASAATAPDAEMRAEITRAMICLAGAMGGGFLGMAWKPAATQRQNLFLVFVNFCAGALFSPFLVEVIADRYGLRAGLPLCLATGGGVAAFFVLVVRAALPIVLRTAERAVAWWARIKFDGPKN